MSLSNNLSDQNRHISKHELTEEKVSPSPFEQFAWWFDEAGQSGIKEPNAVALGTATISGKPSMRMVLLKSFDEKGFIFYTNYHSRKGRELEANNQAALLFFWDVLERQVRIEGTVEKIAVQLSDEYFSTRPYESRLSAIVSEQSAEIPSRQFLEDKLELLRPTGSIHRPVHWGGFRLRAVYFEFWQGRTSRLHDRIVYSLENGAWKIKRLAP